MADLMVIDGVPIEEGTAVKKVKKTLKRKRIAVENVSVEEREGKIKELKEEIESLLRFFREGLVEEKLNFEEKDGSLSGNSLYASLIEESGLPYSKLVDEIYEKLKSKDGITLASVRSSVLLVGQRVMYGIGNADADVLEDDSDKCLWCWETRELKLIPKGLKGVVNARRVCRKRIQERIVAVSAMISALETPHSHPSYKDDLAKASGKLVKVLNEAAIRQLVQNMAQTNRADMAEKEAKLKEKELAKELERKEKELTKELERNKREVEKEKKRMELHNEKESKRLQEEAEKEAKRREKEEAEMKKQIKRQQEEAEKEQRRQEKEAAELKKQLAVKKQATMMERFFKSKKDSLSPQDGSPFMNSPAVDTSVIREKHNLNAATSLMDSALSSSSGIDAVDLWKSHVRSWNRLGRSRLDRSTRWGLRCKPKSALVKELKLHASTSETARDSAKLVGSTSKGVMHRGEMSIDKLVDEWEETNSDDKLGRDNADTIRICNGIKKLLQFDKSNRPAYYGTLSKKSNVIGPRHPFRKDPDLDYDIESDEEWEEEEPGESLSDCEKDEEEDISDEANVIVEDEDGSEDGFFVPDGYLSENEGVHVDSMEVDSDDDGEAQSSATCKENVESDELHILLRQQNYINKLTHNALLKNKPLIISNLMHEKAALLMAEDLHGTSKIEQMFLQSLSIRPFPGSANIQISADNNSTHEEDEEVFKSHNKSKSSTTSTPSAPVSVIEDMDLPTIVSVIQSCPQAISKVIESLQQIFPKVSKKQLGTKVREISQFAENKWQVKKEILDKLGSFPGCAQSQIQTPAKNCSTQQKDEEVAQLHDKGSTATPSTPPAPVSVIQDKDLPKIVAAIQSSPQAIAKVIESLQQSFPMVSKIQLGSKVREISQFVDNRWQVKKEILDKLGISPVPKKIIRTKSITTFFSKRCLPPDAEMMKAEHTSPQPCRKRETPEEQECSPSLL
ncbi:hypothetical protein C5167_029867 [Papaver somniferum]|uniref:chromatin assembly factor 1 subunit FAS1-like n=1 Tax=Papaver somniferum TaxID=3469 RepID=UPI000E6FDCF3|nr:chromatin assembly factor 1 subunit FAS1-like [Papaver somniferum]RZC94302.1 hypothetical protein C5167_029867 [Papaver somniferum]